VGGTTGDAFSILRGPLYPVLLVPGSLAGAVTGSPTLTLVLSHLLAVLLLGLLFVTTFALFRLHLGRLSALTGVLLLALNVLVIGNGPLAKEDLPGTLFLTAAFFFYLKAAAAGGQRFLLLAGICIGLAASTRYSLLPVPFVVIAGYEAIDLVLGRFSRDRIRALLPKLAYLGVLPIAVIFAIPTLVYVAAHRSSLLHAPAQFIQDLLTLRGVANAFNEDALRNYRFVVEMVTWPLLLAGVIGLVACIWRRQRIAAFYVLWFATVFGLHTYGIVHKEARYLLAALPAIYWFCAVGLEAFWRLTTPWRDRFRLAPAGAMAVIAALLLLPAAQAISAVARFTDPVYSQPYERQLSQYAWRLAGGRTITWIGPYYPLHPKDYVFDSQDPFTYVYHFYWHVVSFWALRPAAVIDLPVAPAGDGSPALQVSWHTIDALQDGEVLIINRESRGYDTGNLPRQLSPLVVERLSIHRFTATGPGAWTSPDGGVILAAHQDPGWRIDGRSLADGHYQLYAAPSGDGDASLTPVTVHDGRFSTGLSGPAALDTLALVSYDSASAFPPPT
jgi:hypothetical protein